MKYLTGIHALNLPCKLNTCGDWHCSGLRWKNLSFKESEQSVWGDYGIETHRSIPFLSETNTYNVANHIRALLDLLYEGNFSVAQGMKEDFICTDEYDEEIFGKVFMLKDSSRWFLVNKFMQAEYGEQWEHYLIKCS